MDWEGVVKKEQKQLSTEYITQRGPRLLGDQIWTQNGPDWSQMGQIRDFFRSGFQCTESDLKKKVSDMSHLANMTYFGCKFSHPDENVDQLQQGLHTGPTVDQIGNQWAKSQIFSRLDIGTGVKMYFKT